MKKLLTIAALLLAMVLLLTACAQKEEEKAAATDAPAATATAEPTAEPTTEPTAESTTEPAAETEPAPEQGAIIGTWLLTGIDAPSMPEESLNLLREQLLSGNLVQGMTFAEDGKVLVFQRSVIEGQDPVEQSMNATYTIEGDTITVTDENGKDALPSTFRIVGDTMEMDEMGVKMVFVRQN